MTPGFEIKKLNNDTLPEFLKSAREHYGYPLSKLSKVTGISEKFLTALEDGYYHRLPAEVYVYGFLRTLGMLYQVEPKALIEQYKKERGVHEKRNDTNARPLYRLPKPSNFAITPKTITLALFFLLIAGVIGYIIYEVHLINQPPKIVIDSPQDGATIHDSSMIVRGKTDPDVVLSLNGQAIPTDSTGGFSQPISVSQGSETFTLVAVNNFGKQSSKQFSITGDPPVTAPPAATTAPTSFSITVSAQGGPVALKLGIDGAPDQSVTLNNGASQTFTAKNTLNLTTSNAGDTYVQVNNCQAAKLGKPGQPITVPFTLAAASSQQCAITK